LYRIDPSKHIGVKVKMVRWILSGSGFNFNEINSSVRILIQQRRYNLSTTEEYDEDLNLISLRLKPVVIMEVASGTSCSASDAQDLDQDLISLRLKLVNQIDRVVIPLLVHYCIRRFGPEINLNEIKNLVDSSEPAL
jgi:hypothetical protein